jgi:DNA-binding NarL/FixJ family response regulator
MGAAVAVIYAGVAGAHLAAAHGNHTAVIAALVPLLHLPRRDGVDEPGVARWRDLLVDAMLATGDLGGAEAVLAPFERRAASRHRASAMAAAARVRGNIEMARDDRQSAEQAFQAGLASARAVDMPFDRALLEADYGRFLRRIGQRAAAAEHLQAACQLFERLGAHPYLERCRRELRACGLTPIDRKSADTTRLTPQELAAARLVATGLTNRQVASELVLSVKTVEYHLGNVYAKLGISSRSQLVLLMRRDGEGPKLAPPGDRSSTESGVKP